MFVPSYEVTFTYTGRVRHVLSPEALCACLRLEPDELAELKRTGHLSLTARRPKRGCGVLPPANVRQLYDVTVTDGCAVCGQPVACEAVEAAQVWVCQRHKNAPATDLVDAPRFEAPPPPLYYNDRGRLVGGGRRPRTQ